MTNTLSLKAVGHATSLLVAVTFALRAGFDLLFPGQAMYQTWLRLLPGFTWLTWQSFLLGLVEVVGYGFLFGLVFAPLYNFFLAKVWKLETGSPDRGARASSSGGGGCPWPRAARRPPRPSPDPRRASAAARA